MHAAPHSKHRAITSALIIALVFQPLAVAWAATDLTTVPLVVQSQVQPNVLYMLDNSGSMAWGSMTGTDTAQEYTNGAKDMRAYYSPTFNQLYYNPAITYLPGVNYDAAATTTNYTSSMGNSATAAAPVDPYLDPAGAKVDLTKICWNAESADLPAYDPATFANNLNCVVPSMAGRPTQYAQYAFYYVWKGTGKEDGSLIQNIESNYTRVDIVGSTALYAKAATRTDCGTGPDCTYAQELQNFANWFTYYRTRLQTAKTSLGIAFSGLDLKSRVGLATINDNNGSSNTSAQNFVALAPFTSSQMSTWYSKLYGVTPNGATPLIDALTRAGNYYQTGTMQGTSTTRAQTVPLSCTPNYTILSTDGYWNGSDPSTGSSQDTKVPALPANVYVHPDTGAPVNDPIAGVPLVTGDNFPAPFYDGGLGGSSNTLADVAMKYWISDLNAPSAGKVGATPSDPATWQHMVTYTIGLGANGTLTAPPASSGYWPAPVHDDPTAIDDLWHAALNGHGQYFNTKDPAKLQTALTTILNDIASRTGSAAALAVSNPNVEAGDNAAYASSFNSGTWIGDLQAFPINVVTGLLGSTPSWSAQARLDAKPLATRYIATYNGVTGVPFTATGLADRIGRFNSPTSPPGPADGAQVINYLRGDRTGEGNGTNPALPYRLRAHLLGDIVDAEPAYVPAPRANYTDAGYNAFKTDSFVAGRAKVVYQAANDGMLHAFRAVTGDEMWAYVPGTLVNTPLSATYSNTSSLVGLTQQSLFQHRFYVDGTPIATDVDLGNTYAFQPTPTSPNWATILVGGLARGGRGYYALNVTNPDSNSDVDVASRVLWEFPNAATATDVVPNIGYTYGIPLNVKTKATGWVTLVTSGYNNGADTGGDGQGHLFVLNPDTGSVIKDLSTGVGTSANPSGLAKISAYLASPGVDDTADFVYGGDLEGNVWRFDLTGATPASWNVTKLATLVDKNGVPQPVTGSPELGVVNGKRMVYVGTGQYLGATDIPGATGANASATQGQSMYGLMDDLSASPTITPLRPNLVAQAGVAVGTNINVTTNPVNLATKRGWVLDFPTSPAGERAYTSPVLFQGVLAFTTNTPSGDLCLPGGTSNLYFLNYANGGAIPNLASRFVGKVLSSRVQPEGLPGGAVKVMVRTSDGGTRVFGVTATPTSTGPARIMWREVTRN